MRAATIPLISLLVGVLGSCASSPRAVCVPDHIATIAVLRDGTVLLNDEPAPLDQLGDRLNSMNVLGVWVFQERMNQAPSARHAYDTVMDAIHDNRLITMWSTRPDFSTYVGDHTGHIYRRPMDCEQPVRRNGYTIYRM